MKESSDAMEIDNTGSESEGSINDYETDNLDNWDLEPNVKLRKKKKPCYVCINRFSRFKFSRLSSCKKIKRKRKKINLTKLLNELTLQNNIEKST